MRERELSVSEVARRLGVGLPYVYSLLWAGKLEAHKVKRQWRISAQAVEARRKARAE